MEHLKASRVGESSGLLLNVVGPMCSPMTHSVFVIVTPLTKVSRKALKTDPPDPVLQDSQEVAPSFTAQGIQVVLQTTPERSFP